MILYSLSLREPLETAEEEYRGMEQLVARWAHNPKVVGSSPAPATKLLFLLIIYIRNKQ